MDRCALFVDAGYALADGAMAVHGTRRRESVSWDHAGLLRLLASLARDRTGLPVLRCYWYEAAPDGRRTAEHETLAEMPGLKLRLVNVRPGRREGIDGSLRRDLVTLAKNGAITDAIIASSDESLAELVSEVQDLGIRVVVLHIAADGGWTVPQSLRQECDDIVEISGVHLRPFVELIRGAEPALPDEQFDRRAISDGAAARSALAQHGPAVAALPAPGIVYPAPLPADYAEFGQMYGGGSGVSALAENPGRRASSAPGTAPDSRAPDGSGSAGYLTGIVQAGPAHSGQSRAGSANGDHARGDLARGAGGPGAFGQSGIGPAGAGQGGAGQGGAGQGGAGQGGAGSFGIGPGGQGLAGPGPDGQRLAAFVPDGQRMIGLGQDGQGRGGFGQDGQGRGGFVQDVQGQGRAEFAQDGQGRGGFGQDVQGQGRGGFVQDVQGRGGSGQDGQGRGGFVQDVQGQGRGGFGPDAQGQGHAGFGQDGHGLSGPASGSAAAQGMPLNGTTQNGSVRNGGPGNSAPHYGFAQGGISQSGLPQNGMPRTTAGPAGAGPNSFGGSAAMPGGAAQGAGAFGGHPDQLPAAGGFTGGPPQPGTQAQNGMSAGYQPGPAAGGPKAGGPAQHAGPQHGISQHGISQHGVGQHGAGQHGAGQPGVPLGGLVRPDMTPGGQNGMAQPSAAQQGFGPGGAGANGIPPASYQSGVAPYPAQPNGAQASGVYGTAPGQLTGGYDPAAGADRQRQAVGGPDYGYFPGQPGGAEPESRQHASFPAPPAAPMNGYAASPPYPGQQPDQQAAAGQAPALRAPQAVAIALPDAVQAAHAEGFGFGEMVGRDAPALWLEAVLARKPRMPSDLEARLLQGSALPIDSLLHDEVRHSLRRGFWDALENARR